MELIKIVHVSSGLPFIEPQNIVEEIGNGMLVAQVDYNNIDDAKAVIKKNYPDHTFIKEGFSLLEIGFESSAYMLIYSDLNDKDRLQYILGFNENDFTYKSEFEIENPTRLQMNIEILKLTQKFLNSIN